MECDSCGHNVSLSKNIKSPGPVTEKNIEKCPECGEEISKSESLDDSILEKGL